MDLCEVKDKVIECIPKLEDRISRKLLDKVHNLLDQDLELRTNLFDNLDIFKKVYLEGSYRVDSFINASLYVSYTQLGFTKISSYERVYPDRIARLIQDGRTHKAISNLVNAYNKSVLVQKLLGEFQMPSYVMFRDVFYKAVAAQEEILDDPKVSATVKQKAACSLMGHLKEPEVQKVELEVNDKRESSMIKDLLEASNKLANEQIRAIKEGRSNAQEVAHSAIVEGEFSEKKQEH
jgi:hypothetical protein